MFFRSSFLRERRDSETSQNTTYCENNIKQKEKLGRDAVLGIDLKGPFKNALEYGKDVCLWTSTWTCHLTSLERGHNLTLWTSMKRPSWDRQSHGYHYC